MRRPTTLNAAKDRAWNAISKYIRKSYADPQTELVKCVTCDKQAHWKEMHCGHYQHGLTYEERAGQYEVVETNLHPQCAGCNTYRNGQLDRYSQYILDYYGRSEMDRLIALKKSGKPLKMTIDDYWEIEKEYSE